MEIALIKSYTEKPWRSPETYHLIEESLSEKWDTKSIHTCSSEILHNFLSGLQQTYGDSFFAFNIAEYLDEDSKGGFLPAMLDKWNIPHLGSSAEAIAIGLDKARTKMLLNENQIPTPRFFVADRATDLELHAKKIGYPLIVKPISEGGHIGINEDSIVYDTGSLANVVDRINNQLDQPAIVEEYITGEGMREFSVGIIDGVEKLFTPIEIDYESMGDNIEILSYEAAEKDLERIKLVQDKKIRDEIIDLAERTFNAVGASDYSRVDIRMNETGYYVLEINTMPGLGPHSFLPEAAKAIHSLEYNQFIQKLAEISIKK